jgi:hypothetical protein
MMRARLALLFFVHAAWATWVAAILPAAMVESAGTVLEPVTVDDAATADDVTNPTVQVAPTSKAAILRAGT